eukprot:5562503-Amphidinium_carterae.3
MAVLTAEQMVQLLQHSAGQVAQTVREELRHDGFTTKTFAKPKVFDGSDTSWPTWAWKFEAACTQLGLVENMRLAATSRLGTLRGLADLDADDQRQARLLYLMLVDCCEGKVAVLLKPCEVGNGFVCWSKLKQEYEGSSAVRFQGMLRALMSPSWTEEVKKGRDFGELFLSWETQVATYEVQRGRALDLDVKVAVVMRHAPEDAKIALRQTIMRNSKQCSRRT